MKTLFALSIVLLCAGCGPHVEISYVYNAPPEQLEKMAGYPVLGYAHYDRGYEDLFLKVHCTIRLVPFDLFVTDACYQAVLEHERKHCYEGEFHPNTPEGSAVPECGRTP